MFQGGQSDERNTTNSPNQSINPKAGHSLHSPSSPTPTLSQLLLACSFSARELVGNKMEGGLRWSRGTICERWGGPFPPFLQGQRGESSSQRMRTLFSGKIPSLCFPVSVVWQVIYPLRAHIHSSIMGLVADLQHCWVGERQYGEGTGSRCFAEVGFFFLRY